MGPLEALPRKLGYGQFGSADELHRWVVLNGALDPNAGMSSRLAVEPEKPLPTTRNPRLPQFRSTAMVFRQDHPVFGLASKESRLSYPAACRLQIRAHVR